VKNARLAAFLLAWWLLGGACNPDPCQSGCGSSSTCASSTVEGFVCQDLLASGCHAPQGADPTACEAALSQSCLGSDGQELSAVDNCLTEVCTLKASVAVCYPDAGLTMECLTATQGEFEQAIDAGF
jgi:hypothetical protein